MGIKGVGLLLILIFSHLCFPASPSPSTHQHTIFPSGFLLSPSFSLFLPCQYIRFAAMVWVSLGEEDCLVDLKLKASVT